MSLFTDTNTDSRIFSPGYPVLDKAATGRWQCFPLQQGLQVQTIDITPRENLPVAFNRREPHMEFGCLFSGKLHGSLKADNGREEYFFNNPGQLWCSFSTKAQGVIEYLSGSPVYSVSFIIHGDLLKQILSMKGVLPDTVFHDKRVRGFNTLRPLDAGAKRTAGLITNALDRPDPSQHLFLIAKAYELLSRIFMGKEDEQAPAAVRARESAVKSARRILDDNLSSPPSLEMLARKSGLCVTYLTEAFKETFGTTVFGYVRQQRLSRARELIAVHGMSASGAAWEVGYSSLSAFHRAFLAAYGTTPGSYRRQMKTTA